jgi:pimeloyl-ACP methyl ester carboxylesterase
MGFWQIAGLSLAGFVALLFVFLCFTSLYHAICLSIDERKYPATGKLVDVGGYRLHITIRGEGGPTVVMDAGLAHISTVWSLVQPEVAMFTRVCAVDRAGHAWSDHGPFPRTSRQICQELHALLTNAGLAGPYVLVGHSFGGLNMYLYASMYPEEVAGLVLLDALSRDINLHTPREFGYFIVANRLKYFLFSRLTRLGIARFYLRVKGVDAAQDFIVHLPLELRYATIAGYLRKTFVAAAGESASLRASVEQARLAQPLRDIPLVVVAHGIPEMFMGHMSPAEVAQVEQRWQKMQAELAQLSPSGTFMVAEKSGHKIHIDQPELVVEIIRQVVEAARMKISEG